MQRTSYPSRMQKTSPLFSSVFFQWEKIRMRGCIIMLVKEQKILIRWNGNNRHIYETKGYKFTKYNEIFEVDINDVPSGSHSEAEYKCDFCGEHFFRDINHAYDRKKHFCSDECRERDKNPQNLTNSERLDYSINCLKYLQSKLNKTPTASQYDEFAKKKGAYSRRILQFKLNKNWNRLCKELFDSVNVTKRDKDLMLQELINLKNRLGRTPLTEELVKYGLSEYKTYMRKFNMTYNELIKSLGWEANGNFTAEIPKEELYDLYRKLYNKLGRVPLWSDIRNEKDYPSTSTFYNKLGSISDICKHIGIQLDSALLGLNSVGYGLTLVDDNADFCRSYPEMIITNLLIKNKLSYIKEYKYCNLIENDNSRRRFDWYLPDYNIAVEYFGLYTENPNNEILLKYHNKTNEKINICKENNIKLIDLYNYDLENNLEGFINKLNTYKITLVV